MKIFSLLITIFITISSAAQNNYPVIDKKETRVVAVTIDDLPFAAAKRYPYEKQKEIIEKLIATLITQNIPIIGFVNEDKLLTDGKVDDRKVNFLRTWLNAGFDLGNHTYSHRSANVIPAEEFKTEIISGEKVIRKLIEENGRQLKYFRHPYLQTGRSMETKNEIENFLHEHRYKIAPVTIDNSEWIFASAYDKALDSNKAEAANHIGKEYIEYMKQKFEYWENQTQALFGREIKHILLIHANTLNADYFSMLCKMMQAKDYEFISLDEALKDKAYKTNNTFTGRGGISWIHRWAITAGKPKEFFVGEPLAPKWICDYAGVEAE